MAPPPGPEIGSPDHREKRLYLIAAILRGDGRLRPRRGQALGWRSAGRRRARSSVGVAAADEDRLGPGFAGGRAWIATRPSRHAAATTARGSSVTPEPGGDAAEDRLERAELEHAAGRHAAPGQDLLEPLAVGAAGAQHQILGSARPASASSAPHRRRGAAPAPPRRPSRPRAPGGPPARRRRRPPAGASSTRSTSSQARPGPRGRDRPWAGGGEGGRAGARCGAPRWSRASPGGGAPRRAVLEGGAAGLVEEPADAAGVGQRAAVRPGYGPRAVRWNSAVPSSSSSRRTRAVRWTAPVCNFVGGPAHTAEPHHRLEHPQVRRVHAPVLSLALKVGRGRGYAPGVPHDIALKRGGRRRSQRDPGPVQERPMPVPHRAALAAALAASLLAACATPPAAPPPQAARLPAPVAADAVKVGQSRAEVEAALGVPTQVEEDAEGVQAVYMTGHARPRRLPTRGHRGTRRRRGAGPARDRYRPSRAARPGRDDRRGSALHRLDAGRRGRLAGCQGRGTGSARPRPRLGPDMQSPTARARWCGSRGRVWPEWRRDDYFGPQVIPKRAGDRHVAMV